MAELRTEPFRFVVTHGKNVKPSHYQSTDKALLQKSPTTNPNLTLNIALRFSEAVATVYGVEKKKQKKKEASMK